MAGAQSYEDRGPITLADRVAKLAEPSTDIAIIGIDVRCPGARNARDFWQNLRAGVNSLTTFTDDELEPSDFFPVDRTSERFIPVAGVIDGAAQFDAAFFGLSKAEATAMDPQHRLFLQACWTAMEDAGHDLTNCGGNVAVYAGSASNTYMLSVLGTESRLRSYQGLVGNDKDYLATRVSYKLNLSGESVAVQTACSTSLVAVHLACQSLLLEQCDFAFAGGVSVQARQRTGYMYQEDAIFSPDGSCRAFDAAASGTVFSNGLGTVVLRRLDDALDDGDRIYAVIKGTAVNNDASAKMSYLAPSVEAQAAVVAAAMDFAEISAHDVGFVEAHGTATPIGDPIEVEALNEAYRRRGGSEARCALGSVKTNIGHLGVGAGVVGLIKTALVLHHREIPESLGFEQPNPMIDFAGGPFYVPTALQPWPGDESIRYAGVSSFGIGGTNAHAVLELPPAHRARRSDEAVQIIPVSGIDTAALRRNVSAHRDSLEAVPEGELGDYAMTAALGRRHFRHRVALVGSSPREIAKALDQADEGPQPPDGPVDIAFLLPGQGAEHPAMGRTLYNAQPAFAEALDACLAELEAIEPSLSAAVDRTTSPATADTHLRVATYQYAMAQLLSSWGIQPTHLVGHSLGEVSAGIVAGAWSLSDGLRVTRSRGELLESARGAMLGALCSVDMVGEILGEDASSLLASLNGSHAVVLSGPADEIRRHEATLTAAGVGTRILSERYAFHSEAVSSVQADFASVLNDVSHRPLKTPIISCLNGTVFSAGEIVPPDHWVTHLRAPVRFDQALRKALPPGRGLMLELGPSAVLTPFARRLADADRITCTAVSTRETDEAESALRSLAAAFECGLDIDWAGVHRPFERARRSVATYVFAPTEHWLEPPTADSVVNRHPRPTAPADGESRQPAPGAVDAPAMDVAVLDQVVIELVELVAQLMGEDEDLVRPQVPLLEVGLDSLVMIEAAEAIRDRYGVAIGIRELLAEVTTIDEIAAFIVEQRPDEPASTLRAAQPADIFQDATFGPSDATDTLEGFLERQLGILSGVAERQIELLTELRTGSGIDRPARVPSLGPGETASRQRVPFVPYQPITVDEQLRGALIPGSVDDFLSDYADRTRGSKELAARHRPTLADNDNRVVSNFRMALKEIVYPVAIERSSGSHVVDVDQNDYVDLVMGFGCNLFGHSPEFIRHSIDEQLDLGVHVGGQSTIAGDVAAQLCRMTQNDRAVFTNSGTEAVMTAVRLARAVTGRRTVAIFAGSYHGHFDGTLARPQRLRDGKPTAPLAPGVTQGMVDDVLVLGYGDDDALEELWRHRTTLAAVLVEPVQSRRPSLQHRDFLRQLRALCNETGAALIFDEIITGLRVGPGGAQSDLGVTADMATYGKVLGGGFPIGAVAGGSHYLDAIDGGLWLYGDSSFPAADTTFFAGTFCKHPLAMAAAASVLSHLEAVGPQLQSDLNLRTEAFVSRLNRALADAAAPVEVHRYASQFRFVPSADVPLLPYALVANGIHVREGHNCFLSTAHSDDDLDLVVTGLEAALDRLGSRSGSGHKPVPEVVRAEGAPLQRSTLAEQHLVLRSSAGAAASMADNLMSAATLIGPLDLNALARSLESVVARHEGLRAVFGDDGVVLPERSRTTRIEVSHLEAGSAGDDGVIPQWVTSVGGTAIDLRRGPTLRAMVLVVNSKEHVLALVSHHAVVDGWSIALILEELAEAYARIQAGGAPTTVTAPGMPSYRDWLRAYLDSGAGERARDYWLEQLTPTPLSVALPTDRHRPPRGGSFTGSRVDVEVEAELGALLRASATEAGVTPFTLLLTAFSACLYRLTGQGDLVIGVPVADRPTAESRGIVGHCTNLLPIRIKIEPGNDVTSLLASVSATLANGYEHLSYPFAAIVDDLDLPHDLASGPLVNVTFNLDRRPEVVSLAGLQLAPLALGTVTAAFDLSVDISHEADGGYFVRFDYSNELLDAATVQRWSQHYRSALEALAGGERSLESVTAFPSDQLNHPSGWSTGTTVEHPATTVARHFAEITAAAHADDPAVSAVDGVLTFGELDVESDALARHLLAEGVAPGDVVGVDLAPSAAYAVTLLGIHKAGAAYVYLRGEPPARAGAIADQTGCVAIVGEPDSTVPSNSGLPIFAARPELVTEPSDIALPRTHADDVACIVATSGSTGSPKLVALTHGEIMNRLWWGWRELPYEHDELVGVRTSPRFVDAVAEFFSPLLAGVPLAVLEESRGNSPAAILDLVTRQRVTRLLAVPSILELVADAAAREGLTLEPLRFVVSSGEPLTTDLAQRLRTLAPRAQLINLYGTTETAGDALAHTVTANDVDGLSVPAGRPLHNCVVRILDDELRPVPQGVVGSVYVGGACVARGYLDARETAARFIPDPFAMPPGSRLDSTGDLGRHRADGSVLILGRSDRQITVGGIRVEPDEAAAVIRRHHAVRACAVAAPTDGSGRHRLVAYVVVDEHDVPGTEADIRRSLLPSLPRHLRPVIVLVTRLPRTATGKVDHRELLDRGVPEVAQLPWVGPETAVQRAIAMCWSEVLGASSPGIDEDFFDAGGDSLLAIRAIGRIRETIGADIPIESFFENATIRMLASVAEQLVVAAAPERAGVLFAQLDNDRLSQPTDDTGHGHG
jgi:amino acid adenylation domain-containing protein